MIKLKEYAAKAGVSTEMIRQQTHTYKEQLGEHLIYQKGSYYLDDKGVAILDGIRQKTSPTATIQALKKENQELREEINALGKQFKALRIAFLTGNLSERDLSAYFPFLQGRRMLGWKFEAGHISTTAVTYDRKTYVHLYDTARYSKPPAYEGECNIVAAVDGSKWFCSLYSATQRIDEQLENAVRASTKSAQQPQTAE